MNADTIEASFGAVKDEPDILAEARLEFREIREQTEGMCSCVCINDERCCSCLIQ